MLLPLEDSFADIVGKAQRGLKISDSELASQAGAQAEALSQLHAGEFDEKTLRAVAPILDLNADALVTAAQKRWQPKQVELKGLAMFTTPFEDMTVNSYLIFDSVGNAVAFDSGADCTEMLDFIRERNLQLKLILLTHTHGDHIFDLDRLKSATGAPAQVHAREALEGAESFETPRTLAVGSLSIEARLTWGHSKGGTTYVVTGLSRPVAVVGDAIFAGSMGGGAISFSDALSTNRAQILTLPGDTVICPGHGPLTSVAEEKAHNPFYV